MPDISRSKIKLGITCGCVSKQVVERVIRRIEQEYRARLGIQYVGQTSTIRFFVRACELVALDGTLEVVIDA